MSILTGQLFGDSRADAAPRTIRLKPNARRPFWTKQTPRGLLRVEHDGRLTCNDTDISYTSERELHSLYCLTVCERQKGEAIEITFFRTEESGYRIRRVFDAEGKCFWDRDSIRFRSTEDQ